MKNFWVILSLFCFGGCGGGGIVDNGAPVQVSGGIASIVVDGQSYQANLPDGDWQPESEQTPTTDGPVRLQNGRSYIQFMKVSTTCAASPFATNANNVQIYKCSETKINLVTASGTIIEAEHNISEEAINEVANSFLQL